MEVLKDFQQLLSAMVFQTLNSKENLQTFKVLSLIVLRRVPALIQDQQLSDGNASIQAIEGALPRKLQRTQLPEEVQALA